jgi:hypothetical protein
MNENSEESRQTAIGNSLTGKKERKKKRKKKERKKERKKKEKAQVQGRQSSLKRRQEHARIRM